MMADVIAEESLAMLVDNRQATSGPYSGLFVREFEANVWRRGF